MRAKFRLLPPWQDQVISSAPWAVLLPGTLRQALEARLRSTAPLRLYWVASWLWQAYCTTAPPPHRR